MFLIFDTRIKSKWLMSLFKLNLLPATITCILECSLLVLIGIEFYLGFVTLHFTRYNEFSYLNKSGLILYFIQSLYIS
jgi:hypothetical protein